jgi:DNA polymerase-3 subunit delta'
LRTPSVKAVAKLLIERDGIDPEMAEFASSAAQGHVGRAKYLAINKEARENREKILNLPSSVRDLASAFEAANTLLEMAKEQAKTRSEIRNDEELSKLKESYGTAGSRLATGGTKAVKELEKEHKNRIVRETKDFIDFSLLEMLQMHHRRIKSNHLQIRKNDILSIKHYFSTKDTIKNNSSSILNLESLFCNLYITDAMRNISND